MGPEVSNILVYALIFQNSMTISEGAASTIIGASLDAGRSLFETYVCSIAENGPNRNVVIEIANHLSVPLYGGNYYLQWGRNKIPPASVIAKNSKEAIPFEKISYTATGTSGVLSYTIDDNRDLAHFAIIFSIPFNYIHAANWFGLAFIDRGTEMNVNFYHKLYYDSAWEEPKIWKRFGYAYESKNIAIFHNDYIISATMSNTGRCVLKVDVQKRAGAYEGNHHKFQGK